jgi:Protein RETICULATA-related
VSGWHQVTALLTFITFFFNLSPRSHRSSAAAPPNSHSAQDALRPACHPHLGVLSAHNRRRYAPGEGRQLEIPPLGMTALTWGLFMGVSSNLRYQAVFGLERVVDKTVARRVPQARPMLWLSPVVCHALPCPQAVLLYCFTLVAVLS